MSAVDDCLVASPCNAICKAYILRIRSVGTKFKTKLDLDFYNTELVTLLLQFVILIAVAIFQ